MAVFIWGVVIYVVSSVVIGRLVAAARLSDGEGPRAGAAWFPFLREWAVAYYSHPRQYDFVLIALFVPLFWPFLPFILIAPFRAIASDLEKPIHAFVAWLLYTAMYGWTIWAVVSVVQAIWGSMTTN